VQVHKKYSMQDAARSTVYSAAVGGNQAATKLAPSAVELVSDDDASASEAEASASEEDVTEWRRGMAEDGDDGPDALEDADAQRVAAAFDELNAAIERNNRIEAANTAELHKVQAQLQEAKGKLEPLSKAHAKQIRKLERFRLEQREAHAAAARLKQLSLDLLTAKEVLECANEALALLQRAQRGEREAEATSEIEEAFREAEKQLEGRRAKASSEVRRLANERRRCAADAERRAKRVVAKSAAVGELAAEALPYLARQASVEEQQRHALATEREAGMATGKAKQQVKDAMSHLEHLSLEIQEAQQSSEAVPVVAAGPPRAADSGSDETELAIARLGSNS